MPRMQPLLRYALLGIGWLSLGLGVLGIVLPLLPTAPFVLLAAACFMRSSSRMHDWLVGHPLLGAHISDYLRGRGLRRQTKSVALVTLWLSVSMSSWLLVPLAYADAAMVLMAAGVTIHILRLPTCEGSVA